MIIPFGARAIFHPNEAQGASYHKFDTPGVPGVFAGYVFKDGYRWDKKYIVWDLRDRRTDASVYRRPITGHLVPRSI
eukprot:11186282-Lingulodinium_polyedra.AAC.1